MNADIVKSGLTEVKVLPLKASGQQNAPYICVFQER